METVMKKLNAVVLMATLAGSLALGGCKSRNENTADGKVAAAGEASNAVAPEENVATAPVEETSGAPGLEKDSRFFHYYAPHAPPAMRREMWGRAPSERHFWAPGYYRWNGHEHVWYDGSWQLRRSGYEYASPTWVVVGSRWAYRPGRWYRR